MELVGVISGLVGASVSLITLVALFVRGIFSVEKRLTRLETQIEPYWDALRKVVADLLSTSVRPAGNPITPERWAFLLEKMKQNTLTLDEALELNNAMVEKQQEAIRDKDNAALIAIGLGLALLAVVLLGARKQ